MNDYDATCRFLLRAHPVPLLRWLLRLSDEPVKFHSWLEARLTEPGRTERISDTIAWLTDPARHGEPWAVVIEFQTDPDPDMFGRLLEYLGATYRLFRPSEEKGDRFHVGAVVVNLRGTGRSFRRVEWRKAGLGVTLKGREWNLAALDAHKVLRWVIAGSVPRPVLPFVPLMKRGGEPGTIKRWLEIARAEPNPKTRADLAQARVFADAADRGEAWHKALEGWDVNESPTVRGWVNEGRVKGMAEFLLGQMETRFGALPDAVRAAVRGTKDSARLQSWGNAILQANTLDEFRELAGI